MALTEKQIDDLVADILSGSQERFLEEMTASAAERFERAVQGLGGTQVAEAQLEQLARDWPEEARKLLAKYSSAISDEVAESVEATLMSSHAEDEASMKRYRTASAGASVAAGAASGVAVGVTTEAFARRAAEAAKGIAEIIRRQNIVMEQAAEKVWYEACEEAVNRAVLGTMTEREIIAKGVAKMADIGCTHVTYGRNGKKTVSNFVDVAIRRHVRTQTAQAGARMTIALLKFYGHDLVITDAHWGARPEHAVWQGIPCCLHRDKKVDGVLYEDIHTLTGYKRSVTGLLGANCTHKISPYYPGITPLPDRDFKKLEKHYGMTSNEYYEASQKQRAWERRIRQTKREIAVMESTGIGLESPTYVQKRLVLGRQQKAVAKLCKEKKLPRQYDREKAYGIKEQPRALKAKPVALARKAITDIERERSKFKAAPDAFRKGRIKDLENNGAVVIAGNDAKKWLDARGQGASSIGDWVFLRDDATLSEILEEEFHFYQNKRGDYAGDPMMVTRREIDAQNYLLGLSSRYKIPRVEIEQTQRNLAAYLKELDEYIEKNNR